MQQKERTLGRWRFIHLWMLNLRRHINEQKIPCMNQGRGVNFWRCPIATVHSEIGGYQIDRIRIMVDENFHGRRARLIATLILMVGMLMVTVM